MKQYLIMLTHNLRLLWAARSTVVSVAGLALLLAVLASLAFRTVAKDPALLYIELVGAWWLSFLFVAVIGLNHSFQSEKNEQALLGVLLTRVDAGTVYLAKCTSLGLYLFCCSLLVLFGLSLFLNVILSHAFFSLMLLAFLGALAVASLGTLLASMSVATKERDVLLPLILYPLLIPVFVGLLSLSQRVMLGASLWESGFWLEFLCVYDIISLAVSWVLFEHTLKG